MKPSCLLHLLLLLLPVPASAQEATALLEQGVEARRAGDDARARELFEQAYLLEPTGLALGQLGLAEQALGQWVRADAHLRGALETEDEFVLRNRATLEQALETIQRHLGRIELLGGQPGAHVLVNGDLRGTMPLEGPIRAALGDAVVEVRLDGYHTFRRTLTVTAESVARETVRLLPTETEDAEATQGPRPVEPHTAGAITPAPPTAGRGGDGVPFYIIGAGAAVLTLTATVIGIGYAVSRENHAAIYNGDQCLRDGMTRAEACPGQRQAVLNDEAAYTAAFVTGGALALVSVVFFVIGAAVDGGGDEAEASFGCGSGPGELGLSCTGSF